MNVLGEAIVAIASWQRMVTSMALGMLASTAAQSQSIEFTRTSLFIGQPLDLELRVRFDGPLPDQALSPHCFQIQIHHGEEEQAGEDIHVSLRRIRGAGGADADTVVKLHLRGRRPIEEPWIQGHLSLRCGAVLTREFTLLANPAPAEALRAQAPIRPKKAVRRVTLKPSLPQAPQPTPTPISSTFTAMDITHLQRSQQDLMRVVAALEARLEEHAQGREQAAMITTTPGPPEVSSQGGWPWWMILIGIMAFLWGRHSSQPPRQPEPHQLQAPLMTDRRPTPPPPSMAVKITAPPTRREDPAGALVSPAASINFPWPTESGEPSLDKPELDVPLSTLDHAAAEGYLGATLAVLETTLQVRRSKSADLLLRLLDGYEALQQPMNRARVASQLEALYNVDTRATHPSLDEMAHPMVASLVSAWQQADRTSALAHLLLEKKGSIPVLDLAAFREILWLHHLSLEDEDSEPKLGLAVLH
jgi:hypothetical protein